MRVNDQDAEIRKPVVPWRRQGEPVADALGLLIGTGQHIEFECEIGGIARHWPNNSQIAPGRVSRRLRWPGAALGHKVEAWLVREDAAEMRRTAQRAADVGAEF